jgi:ABC-type amino acid transport substrate-binding protein
MAEADLVHPKLSTGLSIIAACVLLVSCSDSPDSNDRLALRIATDATFAPFHLIGADGRPTGFDVELAGLLAERAGYEAIFLVLPYDQLFDDLLGGNHDVVAATTGITAEREEKYLFTTPYYDTCQAALVRVGADEPGSLAELAGRRVGASGAGTSVRALDKLTETEYVLLNTGESTILDDGSVPDLQDGTIDALVVDEFDAVEAARASGGRLRVLSEPVALEQYALVLRPDDTEIKRRLDNALEEARNDGSLARLEQKYGLDRGAEWPIELPAQFP